RRGAGVRRAHAARHRRRAATDRVHRPRLGRSGLDVALALARGAGESPGEGVLVSFALDGVRILELARFQAGPRGGMVLSDLGAEVIKIEPPGGEEARKHPPLVRGPSVYFTVYNPRKKSNRPDMRNPP